MGFLPDNRGGGTQKVTFCLDFIGLRRLTLFARLAIVSGLFLFAGTSLFAGILVRNDLISLHNKLKREAQGDLSDISSIITEKAIIGDYASIEQFFRTRVRSDDLYGLKWTDVKGDVVESSLRPMKSSAPAWFQIWADQIEINETDTIVVGGRQYGTLEIKHTGIAGVNAIWHNITIQIKLILVAFIAFMSATLLLLRRGLRPLANLAAAADQFGEGDYSARVPITKLPDMEKSVQAFNNMAGTIETLLQQQSEHEKKLRKSEARLMEAQRIAHIGCWELEHKSGITYCSDEISRIIERHPDEIDSSFEGFINLVHSDDRDMVMSAFVNSLEQHTPCSVSCRLRAPEDRIKYVQWQWETSFDNAGNPLLSLGTIQDVTALKDAETEKENLIAQLSQSQKIESIGRLAAGIAHDFNNLLTPIIGYAGILSETLPSGSRDLQKIKNILLAADKAKTLTQQLLGFGRKQILDMKVIDVNDTVNSFYEILRRTIRENIDIKLCLTNDVLGIKADKNQLSQIIMNLAVNAQDAIADNGVLIIETAPVVLDEEITRQHANMTPGKYLMLAISDNGSGMDNETLSRLFEPFFTTKAVGKGTGLGLSMVYGLVQQHKGFIWAFSEIGKGSVFKLYFPIVSDRIEIYRESVPAQLSMSAAGCSILLVEDNEMVRTMVKELFCRHQFNVIEAEGPKKALELVEGKKIDLLVTDVVMPEMNGPELHECLLRSYPGLKVLYMSGFTNNFIDNQGILQDGINFIQKPFTGNDLALKVEALFNT